MAWHSLLCRELPEDRLPEATFAFQLDYPGLHSLTPDAKCRIRIFRQPVMPTVIVATELPNNPGTSITNRSELVYAMGWLLADRPWPCVFFEHYHDHVLGHRYSIVTFETDPSRDGRPLEVAHWIGGDASPDLKNFCGVEWQHIDPQAVLELVTTPGPAIKEVVAAAAAGAKKTGRKGGKK